MLCLPNVKNVAIYINAASLCRCIKQLANVIDKQLVRLCVGSRAGLPNGLLTNENIPKIIIMHQL